MAGLSGVTLTALPAHADSTASQQSPSTNAADYTVVVTWKTKDGDTDQFLQVMTTEGGFQVNTVLPHLAMVAGAHTPESEVSFHGELKAVASNRAKLSADLSRSVPAVEAYAGSSRVAGYQMHQESLSSTLIVTFGKPVVIQRDGNGEISVLVTRDEP